MEQNFKFIWMYTLQVVKYYLIKGDTKEAYRVFDAGIKLVGSCIDDTYSIAVSTLGADFMEIIWEEDGKQTTKLPDTPLDRELWSSLLNTHDKDLDERYLRLKKVLENG